MLLQTNERSFDMATWSKEVFAKNLRRYMERKEISQKELAVIVGVSAPTINEWIKAKKYPRIDKIEILSNYFGCLKSDLIEEKKEQSTESELSIKKKEFIEKVEKMTDAQIERLEQILALVEQTDL
jgi:transcriptional regulator with XRE-family HTH domain